MACLVEEATEALAKGVKGVAEHLHEQKVRAPTEELAKVAEIEGLVEKGAFVEVDRSEAVSKPLEGKWVTKEDQGWKARFVVKGFLEPWTGQATYSPTTSLAACRFALAVAHERGHQVVVADIGQAFLNAS